MGIFSKVFNKEEEESIAFDANKIDVPNDTDGEQDEDPTAGCNRCKNKQGGFCKGKVFRCEAFRPVGEEQTNNDES